jgi:polysaccharide deacetylase 2 family uncharacterized protein YibQ
VARRARSRSRRNRREKQEGGRQLNIPLIAGLALFGVMLGLFGWAWLSFDEEAFEAAMKPPVVQADIAPAEQISQSQEEKDLVDEGEDDRVDDDGAPTPEGDVAETSDSSEEAAQSSEIQADAKEQAEPVAAPPPLPEEKKVALAPAPQPDLVADGPEGPLPVIAPDGRMAWQVYARPFDLTDPKIPKIAVIIGGLGLSQAATEAAIQQLPGAVTLAFVPYARNLEGWIAQARAAGHEVLLELPMEPFDYPNNDPGPHTLLTTLDSDENLTRLDWLLSRFTGYVGVTNFMGAKFTASAASMEPILAELNDRGLLYLDSTATRNSVAGDITAELEMPSVVSNKFIDRVASRIAIDARLFELERIAKSSGSAVGIGFSYPVTVERVSKWAKALRQKRYALAPLSAVVQGKSPE